MIDEEIEYLKQDELLHSYLLAVRVALIKPSRRATVSIFTKRDEVYKAKNYAYNDELITILKKYNIEMSLTVFIRTSKSAERDEAAYEYYSLDLEARYLR